MFFFFEPKLFSLGVNRVNVFRRRSRTEIFLDKKKRLSRKKTRTTQQPPLLPEEVKHIAPTYILGTSGMGKAMGRVDYFLIT